LHFSEDAILRFWEIKPGPLKQRTRGNVRIVTQKYEEKVWISGIAWAENLCIAIHLRSLELPQSCEYEMVQQIRLAADKYKDKRPFTSELAEGFEQT
jgi:hypothetical protein